MLVFFLLANIYYLFLKQVLKLLLVRVFQKLKQFLLVNGESKFFESTWVYFVFKGLNELNGLFKVPFHDDLAKEEDLLAMLSIIDLHRGGNTLDYAYRWRKASIYPLSLRNFYFPKHLPTQDNA